jgi:hypothetical protein
MDATFGILPKASKIKRILLGNSIHIAFFPGSVLKLGLRFWPTFLILKKLKEAYELTLLSVYITALIFLEG